MIPPEYKQAIPFDKLRPAQEKAIKAGLLEGKNILVATPTASGKTAIAVLALMRAKLAGKKGVYVAPLKALAAEKAREFKAYPFSSTLSVGDYDENDTSLGEYDVILATPEKLDSLMRHSVPWLSAIDTIVIDEVHLLGDNSRGPTLELLITLLRHVLPSAQLVALSATVSNANELAQWLNAELVYDEWRPIELREAIHTQEGLVYKKNKN